MEQERAGIGTARDPRTLTLGFELERRRLELRVRRVAAVVAALRTRADSYRGGPGVAPRHLGSAIADFETEFASIQARLAELRWP